ncbi:cell division protein ZapD, partial [Burkholderia pyrrocinia]
SKVMAMQGSYQQMLSGRSYQLMQVRVAPELRVIPEASAN